MRYLFVAILSLFFVTANAQDTIYPKSGQPIIVDIISEDNRAVTYTVWGKSFPKTMNFGDIQRIGLIEGAVKEPNADYPTGVLMVDGRAIPSDLNYMTVRGVLYPQRFYYKVDCGFSATMGDMSFMVNGIELKFRSPMDIVRYVEKQQWEFISINNYSSMYGDYGTTISEMLFKRKPTRISE